MDAKISDMDDWAGSAPNLKANLSILSSDHIQLAEMLICEGQSHLFAHWPNPGLDDVKKSDFFDQVFRLNSSYPGGLESYIKNAKRLLKKSKDGINPFLDFTPSVPEGEKLNFGDDNFMMLEEEGIKEAHYAAFVLVAGGLGERLGYNGIKLALPVETTTGTCFLQHYIESILALQEASCKRYKDQSGRQIPLVIMTSDDTHAPTKKLLELNSYFRMNNKQVTLLKQEKVACLEDNDARLALDPNDNFKIQTKPHGHGDVHALLYSIGIVKQWKDAGIKWALFFQDTNGLIFNAIPASLGVSSTKDYHVNSLAIRRKAKEANGGITKLSGHGKTMVINVEYNQLDPLLKVNGYTDGDVNCETGYSPFPGNINQLILKLGPYLEELSRTKGAIEEFVNPKYKDASKTSFKSTTRLECMMQDYPKSLSSSARVGFTLMDTWLAYAPVKNNPEDAAKVPKGNPHHSATSGEMAIYRANCLLLKEAGVQFGDPVIDVFNEQEVKVWPRITWKPKWALTLKDAMEKVLNKCYISRKSTMVINGQNVILDGLSLDGTIVINAVNEAEVHVRGHVQNKGWNLKHIDYKDVSFMEEARIRGFEVDRHEQLELNYNEPGYFSTANVENSSI